MTGVLTQIATAAPTVARWLVAAVAPLFASAGGAEVQYLREARFAVGDKPGDVASYSEVVLTEYRFQAGGHSYAMSRADSTIPIMRSGSIASRGVLLLVLTRLENGHEHAPMIPTSG